MLRRMASTIISGDVVTMTDSQTLAVIRSTTSARRDMNSSSGLKDEVFVAPLLSNSAIRANFHLLLCRWEKSILVICHMR